MLKKAFVTLASSCLLLTFASPIFAEEVQQTEQTLVANFSSELDNYEIERQQGFALEPIVAWEISPTGEKTYVKPKNLTGAEARVPSDGYVYSFNGYTETNRQYDEKRFFISKVFLENTNKVGTTPIALKYTQQNTVVTNWEVSGNISANAEFKVSFLAKLNASLNIGGKYAVTDTASTTVEQTASVPARTYYEIRKYRAGGYGAGQAEYKKYSPGGTSLVGMYYEGASGWVPSGTTIGWTHASHAI